MSDYATETEREVENWPGAGVSFAASRRHNIAVLSYRGGSRKVVFAATPSDNARGLQNHIAVIRQELRGLGAVRLKQQPSPRKDRQRNKPVRCLIPENHPAQTPPAPATGLAKLKEMVMASVSQIAPFGNAPAGTVHWLNTCIERSKSGVISEVIMVTPALASEFLRRNEGNRSVKQTKAAQYAADMRDGRWKFNGEPIIVSDTGELNDGQHRMQAIIDANVTLPFLFVFGLTRESRETVDQGAARGAGDYLAMGGMASATTAATISRLLLAYERSGGQNIETKLITNGEVVARARQDEEIVASAKFGHRMGMKSRNYVPGTIIGFCHYLFSDIDQEDAEEYLTQVCTGAGLRPGSPALVVRERLLAEGKSRSKKTAIIFRGWNFHRRGMKVRPNSLYGTLPLPALI